MSIQSAFSPVNFGLNVKPRALKKATVRSRFLMGRLTKSLWDMRLFSFCSMDPPPAEKSSVARKNLRALLAPLHGQAKRREQNLGVEEEASSSPAASAYPRADRRSTP